MYEFKGIHLIDSLVLYWSNTNNTLLIEAELPHIRQATGGLDVLINGNYNFIKTIITFKNYTKIKGVIDITNVKPEIEDGETIY